MSSHDKKNLFFLFLDPLFCWYLNKMTDGHSTYGGHHFIIHVSQTIILYLSLHNDKRQLYFNKTWKIVKYFNNKNIRYKNYDLHYKGGLR